MNKDSQRQTINVIAVIAVLVVNTRANTLPINGLTTGEISDRFDVLFVPAGYVFSIWGLIYIGLIVFAIFQALPAQRENPRFRRTGGLFLLSCLANIGWLLLWHFQQFVLTVPLMLILLLSLMAIYLRLEISQGNASVGERLSTHLTFSIYLGWITVATIANITQTLWFLGWNGAPLAAAWWAVIMLAAGVLLAFLMYVNHRDWVYILVLVWAYAGIAIKQAAVPLVANSAWAAVVALAILAAAAVLRIPRRA